MLRLQRDSLDDQVQRIEWALQEEAAQGDSGAAGTTQQWDTVRRLNQERNAVSPAALHVSVRRLVFHAVAEARQMTFLMPSRLVLFEGQRMAKVTLCGQGQCVVKLMAHASELHLLKAGTWKQ